MADEAPSGLYIFKGKAPEEWAAQARVERHRQRSLKLLMAVGVISWAALLTGWGAMAWRSEAPSATSSIPRLDPPALDREKLFREFEAYRAR